MVATLLEMMPRLKTGTSQVAEQGEAAVLINGVNEMRQVTQRSRPFQFCKSRSLKASQLSMQKHEHASASCKADRVMYVPELGPPPAGGAGWAQSLISQLRQGI